MKIGFTGLLSILFIGLKLAGFITWSWVWVLSPIWIFVILWIIFLCVVFVRAANPAPRPYTWR